MKNPIRENICFQTLQSVRFRIDIEKHDSIMNYFNLVCCIEFFEIMRMDRGERYDLIVHTAKRYPEWELFKLNWDRIEELCELGDSEKIENFIKSLRK